MRRVLAAILVLILASSASAWNAKGHMVIARIVWLKLTPDQRGKVTDILKRHPHFDEFLSADRPENFPEDE